MNLVDKLLAVDKNSAERATEKIRSKRLARLLGEDCAKITIREISGRQFNAVKERAKGGGDSDYEANLIGCTYGIVDPDLKNQQLQEHFGVHTPKDLCEKLFAAEVYSIAEKIVELSGLTDDEEMVKN